MFQELMLGIYRDTIVGAAPAFPVRMEQRITASLLPPNPAVVTDLVGDAVLSVTCDRRSRDLSLGTRRSDPLVRRSALRTLQDGAAMPACVAR